MRQYRKTPKYKEYVKEYSKKNKDRIKTLHKKSIKKYKEKNQNLLSDKYVIGKLSQIGISSPSKEEIEIHRIKILNSRLKKKIDSHDFGIKKICSKCKKEKDISEFWRKTKATNDRVSACKMCKSNRKKHEKVQPLQY